MNLPNDPIMLLSMINTMLRDYYPSLDELCDANGIDKGMVEAKLQAVDYHYIPSQNQFK